MTRKATSMFAHIRRTSAFRGLARRGVAAWRLSVEQLEDRSVPTMLVISQQTNSIVRCDENGAGYGTVFASGGDLGMATGMALGPDGNLYVSNETFDDIGGRISSSILRYTQGGQPLPAPGETGATFI